MKPGQKTNLETEHSRLIAMVEEYLDATVESRTLSEKCRDYKDGYQWTAAEKETLNARNQPCITNNRIKPKVQFLLGMEMISRTDPKAYPRTPMDESVSEVSTDCLRFIADNNFADQELSEGFERYLVEGTEGHEIIVEQNNRGEYEIIHNVIPWDRLFYDPHSRRKDFRDATYLGTMHWMDISIAKDKYPDAPEGTWIDERSNIGYGSTDTFEDRPLFFFNSDRSRIRVFYIYYLKKNTWHYAIYTKGGFIMEPAESPYLDDNDMPVPAFVFQSAFIDIDNCRYGEVASYLDMQDEINKRRSKSLHLLSVRQTFSTKGAQGDKTVAEIKTELAKPDGHVEFIDGEWGKDFGIIQTGDMAMGQVNLLAEAKNEIDAVGANAALSGTEERLLSGRALQSLQTGGSIEIGPIFDGHKFCKNRVHRAYWNRARQFWTEEKWIRVTDTEGTARFSRINGKIRLGDALKEKAEKQGIESLTDEEQVMIITNDPRLMAVIGVENRIQDMDIDIIVDETMDTVTIQQEQFEVLAKLYQANPNAVPFELLIKASQLRNKDELLKLIQGGTKEQQAALAQAREQERQEQIQIAKAGQVSKIEKDKASAQKDIASANKMNAEAKQKTIETVSGIAQTMY